MTEKEMIRKILLRGAMHTLEACEARGGLLVYNTGYLRCMKALGLFGPEIEGDVQQLIFEFRRWMHENDLDDYLPDIEQIKSAVNLSQ